MVSVLLAALVIAGCASQVRTEYARPTCTAPVLSSLPTIDGGELYDLVGPELYHRLSLREKLIVDWGLELEGMVDELCTD